MKKNSPTKVVANLYYVTAVCNLKIHPFLCIYTCGFHLAGVLLLRLDDTVTTNETRTRPPSLRLFGDDVGRQDRLTVLVLGFTDVVSEVDGLHVLYGHDALRHPRGVARPSVNQPPGRLDVNWTAVLHNKV